MNRMIDAPGGRIPKSGDGSARRGAPFNRWLTLLTLCLAVLIAQIDTSVVNLAVRPIGAYFGARVAALQWVIDGYNLTYAALLLSGGLLADLFGRRLIFMIGAAVLVAASLLCAFSPSIFVLIAGRVLAGIGAALLLPSSLAIIRVVWPDPEERGKVLGIWASCNGVALAIGPTLGGVLIARFDWPSIFIVVVPLGLAAFGLAVPAIPELADPQGRHFDLGGQLAGAFALGAFAVAAIEARETAFLGVAALILFLGALAAFLRLENAKGAAALVPLDLFGDGTFRGAMIATIAMTFGMYGCLFLLPLTWQQSGLLGPAGAGLALMPAALLFVLVSPFSGFIVIRLGSRLMAAGGLAIIALGLAIIGGSAQTTSLTAAEIGIGLTGIGMGLATGPLMDLAVSSVPAARSGTAAALINVARMAGATLGVALLGTLYAIFGEGALGLRAAFIAASAVQLACASIAWFSFKSRGER